MFFFFNPAPISLDVEFLPPTPRLPLYRGKSDTPYRPRLASEKTLICIVLIALSSVGRGPPLHHVSSTGITPLWLYPPSNPRRRTTIIAGGDQSLLMRTYDLDLIERACVWS
jgi:hypothetical protein